MCSRRCTIFVSVMAACAMAAAAATAQNRIAKLPPAHVLPQAADSPGAVTFNHESHVDPAAPNCTTCHPRLFKILKPGLAGDCQRITHAGMEKGHACGACHDGQKAFRVDDCTLCHRSE